jgi:DNA-binding MarR family transcriptional regulator
MQFDPEIEDGGSATVLDGIRRIVQALRQSSRQAEADLGLSGAQLFVLRKLHDAGAPLTLGEIAARTLTHPSSVSTVVARLVERGYVVRSASSFDRRRGEVKLAAKGRAFLSRAAPTAQEKLAAAVERLPAKRRALLAGILAALIVDSGFAAGDAAMFFEDETPAKKRVAAVAGVSRR